ncbi:MAG: trypsin-like serine protease [Pseudomonadota bacterium]
MRIGLTALSLAALALAAPLLAQDKAPSALNALETADETRGWEAVGRLNFRRGGFCTAALISERIALTAAHCLFDRHTGRRIDDRDMEFAAGLRRGRAEAYRDIRRSVVHPEYEFSEEVDTHRVSRDLALIELDRPIRNYRISPFDTGTGLSRGDAVGVVSYAEDREEAPSLQETCHVLEQGSGVAMLSCDVDFGASGAPIFRMGKTGPEIVAVVSAKAERDGDRVALASAFGARLTQLHAAWSPQTSRKLHGGGARLNATTSSGGAKFIKP